MDFKSPIALLEILQECDSFIKSQSPPDRLSPDQVLPHLTGFPPFIASLDEPERSHGASLTFLRAGAGARRIKACRGLVLHQGADLNHVPNLQVASVEDLMCHLLRVYDASFSDPKPADSGSSRLGEGNQTSAKPEEGSVHPSAVVEGTVEPGVTVGAFCYIGPKVVVEGGTILESHVTLFGRTRVGSHCRIQSGVKVGVEGFGFVGQDSKALPHPAGVVLEDGVWLGANTVVASGVLHPTRLGRNCKIDSLVQIAHNVEIGEGGHIASQVGIAGSTKIGKRCRIGGGAGINGHVRLGDDVRIAALSGITKSWPSGVTLAGFPAEPIGGWRRRQVWLKGAARGGMVP